MNPAGLRAWLHALSGWYAVRVDFLPAPVYPAQDGLRIFPHPVFFESLLCLGIQLVNSALVLGLVGRRPPLPRRRGVLLDLTL